MPYAHQTASSGFALDHRGGQTVFDRQIIIPCITNQTAGHSAVDPNVFFCFSVQLALGAAQVHLAAVDRCLAVQLSNQTADISISFQSSANGLFSCDLGAGQTDVFQLADEIRAAKGLEQARVAVRFDRQIVDRRMIYPASAVIAFELSVFDWCKFSVEIQLTSAIAFIALELDVPLLHRGGDYRRISDGSSV